MRENVRLRKAEEATALGEVSVRDVRPSTRDFLFAVTSRRAYVVPIAGLVQRDLSAGFERSDVELTSLAQMVIRAGANAIAVGTDLPMFGTDIELLHSVATSVQTPVLRLDYAVDIRQLYASRLAGADAVIFSAGMLAPKQLDRLTQAARSMHMHAIVESRDEEELERAKEVRDVIHGLGDLTGETGVWDPSRVIALARRAPRRGTLVALSGARSEADIEALQGTVDAALVTGPWLGADEIEEAAARIFSD